MYLLLIIFISFYHSVHTEIHPDVIKEFLKNKLKYVEYYNSSDGFNEKIDKHVLARYLIELEKQREKEIAIEKNKHLPTLLDSVRDAKCRPMPAKELIGYDVFSNYRDYHPKGVIMKRCSGCCSKYHSCRPTKTSLITIKVLAWQYLEKKPHIIKYGSEHHEDCGCFCSIRDVDCNPNTQIVDKDKCICQCLDRTSQWRCDKLKNHIWDPDQCKCVCRKEKCDVLSKFDNNICECCHKSSFEILKMHPCYEPSKKALVIGNKTIHKLKERI